MDRVISDILGVGLAGPNGKKIVDVSVEDFDRVYNVNLRGSFNVTKHSIPAMLKSGYGRVLLIASIAGKEGNAVRRGTARHPHERKTPPL